MATPEWPPDCEVCGKPRFRAEDLFKFIPEIVVGASYLLQCEIEECPWGWTYAEEE